MHICIVYDSGYGHTAKQAHAVAEGVNRVAGCEAQLVTVSGTIPWESLESSAAIIFGSPTYNGSMTAKLWAAAGFKDTLLRWKMKPEVVYGNEKAIRPRVQA
jgi:multimeric flavodoxin WrbA